MESSHEYRRSGGSYTYICQDGYDHRSTVWRSKEEHDKAHPGCQEKIYRQKELAKLGYHCFRCRERFASYLEHKRIHPKCPGND